MDFIDCLIRTKDLNHLSDFKFAKRLGVDPSTWSYIRSRHHQPGCIFLRAVIREFPELGGAVREYLGMKKHYLPFFAPRYFRATQCFILRSFNVKSLLDKLNRSYHQTLCSRTQGASRCMACGKGTDKPAEKLNGKALCLKCFREGWRLQNIIHRGKKQTVAWKPIGEEVK